MAIQCTNGTETVHRSFFHRKTCDCQAARSDDKHFESFNKRKADWLFLHVCTRTSTRTCAYLIPYSPFFTERMLYLFRLMYRLQSIYYYLQQRGCSIRMHTYMYIYIHTYKHTYSYIKYTVCIINVVRKIYYV